MYVFFQLWYVVGNHTDLVGGFAMTDACGNSSSSLYVSVCRTTCTRDLHNFLMPKALYCTVPPLLNQFRVSVH